MNDIQDCMYMIKWIHDSLEKHMNQALSEYDLTMLQFGTLVRLHKVKQDCCTMKELERMLHLAQSTTAGLVKRLEQKGYVQTLVDQQDHRIKNVHITPAGLHLCTFADKEVRNTVDRMFGGLETEELQTLIFLLKKICKQEN